MLAGSALAEEKKIKRPELPPAVEKAVVEQSKGATIGGFSEEKENGRTTYEVEMLLDGHSKDVQMDPNGAVIEIEERVDLQAVSSEVRAGLHGILLSANLSAVSADPARSPSTGTCARMPRTLAHSWQDDNALRVHCKATLRERRNPAR